MERRSAKAAKLREFLKARATSARVSTLSLSPLPFCLYRTGSFCLPFFFHQFSLERFPERNTHDSLNITMLPLKKSTLALTSIFLALAAQTSAHAIPNPALGVKGTPQRSDVQRPSTAKPCGNVDITSKLDTSTAIAAAADGSVTLKVQNFNAGADGSTSVSVEVDQMGTGKKSVAGKVTKNGNPKPSKVETDQVTFSLPAGTKCAGGKAKNLCLVSVKTTSGFGACTVVSQGNAAAANPPPKAAPPAAPKPQAATSKAPSIAELAAKNKGKKTVFETC
ncbi:hypothetical protein B0H14DRAFT_2459252, partial [Mycena olivaceomarginata]